MFQRCKRNDGEWHSLLSWKTSHTSCSCWLLFFLALLRCENLNRVSESHTLGTVRINAAFALIQSWAQLSLWPATDTAWAKMHSHSYTTFSLFQKDRGRLCKGCWIYKCSWLNLREFIVAMPMFRIVEAGSAKTVAMLRKSCSARTFKKSCSAQQIVSFADVVSQTQFFRIC